MRRETVGVRFRLSWFLSLVLLVAGIGVPAVSVSAEHEDNLGMASDTEYVSIQFGYSFVFEEPWMADLDSLLSEPGSHDYVLFSGTEAVIEAVGTFTDDSNAEYLDATIERRSGEETGMTVAQGAVEVEGFLGAPGEVVYATLEYDNEGDPWVEHVEVHSEDTTIMNDGPAVMLLAINGPADTFADEFALAQRTMTRDLGLNGDLFVAEPEFDGAPTLPSQADEADEEVVEEGEDSFGGLGDDSEEDAGGAAAAAGVIDDATYESPQFGYTVEWTDWTLDPDFTSSDTTDGTDQLTLDAPSGAFIQITGVAARDDLGDLLDSLLASNAEDNSDQEILGEEAGDDFAAAIVSFADFVEYHEVQVAADGETWIYVRLLSDRETFEADIGFAAETISIDSGPVALGLEAFGLVATADAGEDVGGLATGNGVIDDASYESPQFGYTVEWADWTVDPDFTSSDTAGGIDQLTLDAPSGGFIQVTGVPAGTDPADLLNSVLEANAEDNPDQEVLDEAAGADFAAAVIAYGEFTEYREIRVADDGETWIYVRLLSTSDIFEEDVAFAAETVSIDGGPLALGFGPLGLTEDTADSTPEAEDGLSLEDILGDDEEGN